MLNEKIQIKAQKVGQVEENVENIHGSVIFKETSGLLQ